MTGHSRDKVDLETHIYQPTQEGRSVQETIVGDGTIEMIGDMTGVTDSSTTTEHAIREPGVAVLFASGRETTSETGQRSIATFTEDEHNQG